MSTSFKNAMPVSGMAWIPRATRGRKETGTMNPANQPIPSPTSMATTPTVLHLIPAGSESETPTRALCGEMCAPITPTGGEPPRLCMACDAALWLQIWELCAHKPDPDHTAMEVRGICLRRTMQRDGKRG